MMLADIFHLQDFHEGAFMSPEIAVGILAGIAVYALAYCYLVLRDWRANRGCKFEDLLTPRFRKTMLHR